MTLTLAEPVVESRLDVRAVRRDFPIFAKPLPKGLPLTYLDSAASAQKPRPVIERELEVYTDHYANAYRGVYRYGAQVSEELEETREAVRRFIGAAEPEEIVFTSGTTMSINMVACGWARKFLREGDELLLNEMEHHANLVPWQEAAAASGARLRFIPLTGDGRLDLDRLDEVLTERTKLVAVSGMSNVLGTVNPIAQISARAKQCGAVIVVDGAQSVPHFPVDVTAPPIDFLAFSGHKLYGPTGIGVLYGRRELLEAMDPLLYGGHMISEVQKERSKWDEPPPKFEAGTVPIAQAIALKAAVDYVSDLGFEAIDAHEREVLCYAWDRLREVPGMTIYGPDLDHRGSIISFTVQDVHPEDLALLLDRKGVFVRHGHHCTMPLHEKLGVPATVRASFGLYNTAEDVDVLIDAIHFARRKLRLT